MSKKISLQELKSMIISKLNEEFEVKKFLVRVKHDNGIVRITTTASSEDAAKQKIMSAEGCPERAILSVKEI